MKEKKREGTSTISSSNSLLSLLEQCTYDFEEIYDPKCMAKISPFQLEQTLEEDDIKEHTAESIAIECLQMLKSLHKSFDVRVDQEHDVQEEKNQETISMTTENPTTASTLQEEVDALASELESAIHLLVPNDIETLHCFKENILPRHRCTKSYEKDTLPTKSPHPFGRPTKTVRERMLLLQKKKEAKEKERRKMVLTRKRQRKSIATRIIEDQIYNTPFFWRDHQSKSFETHIQRQQQARRILQQKKEQENELSAIRFRGVTTKKSHASSIKEKEEEEQSRPNLRRSNDSSITSIVLSRSSTSTGMNTKSYLQSYKNQPRRSIHLSSFSSFSLMNNQHTKPTRTTSSQPKKKEILVSVYQYGHRPSHHDKKNQSQKKNQMEYICTTSMEDLKLKIQYKFQMDQIRHVYKECACITELNGKYSTYKRINCFSQLNYGDILCTTSSPYEDMAILCEWIKKRHMNHHATELSTSPAAQIEVRVAPVVVTQQALETSQAYEEASQEVETKTKKQLWDTNGRLVGVKQTIEFPQD